MKTKEYRCKVLELHSQTIAELFIKGGIDRLYEIKMEYGIPEDAEFVKLYYHEASESVGFIFSHLSWDKVPVGNESPLLKPMSYVERLDRDNPNWRRELPPMSEAISCESSKLDNPRIPEDLQSAVNIRVQYVTEDKVVHYENLEEAINSGYKGFATMSASILDDSVSKKDVSNNIIKKEWVNVMGEDYPTPKEPHYKMFHILADELPIDDFNDMIFNSDSSIRTKYSIPYNSKCLMYYRCITTSVHHFIFSHESFAVWHGYEDMMKWIVEGKLPRAGCMMDAYKNDNHPSSKILGVVNSDGNLQISGEVYINSLTEFKLVPNNYLVDSDGIVTKAKEDIPLTEFKPVSEDVFDKVLDKLKPIKEDALDNFLDKYSNSDD